MQLKTVYTDVPASVLYDVLHDPDYRRTWDKFMMEAQESGYLNPNNSVSYYACECMHAPVSIIYTFTRKFVFVEAFPGICPLLMMRSDLYLSNFR